MYDHRACVYAAGSKEKQRDNMFCPEWDCVEHLLGDIYLFTYLFIHLFIYLLIYVCVCVCVCVWRKR